MIYCKLKVINKFISKTIKQNGCGVGWGGVAVEHVFFLRVSTVWFRAIYGRADAVGFLCKNHRFS